jgi:uncharacterized damage-inducible protein DinB
MEAMRPEQARIMASYNRWMNERLYEVCAEIPDAERKRDRKAFFGSIHGTLNHLLLGDKIWLGRFKGKPFQARSLDQELYEDFAELRAERGATDRRIEIWAAGLTEEMLSSKLHYMSMVNPARRTYDLWVAVAHFFNHQTHHRGQLTALLSQCGKDYGVTDLIWLPELLPGGAT